MGNQVTTALPDPTPLLTKSLPRHIIETTLQPSSGRISRSYRIRSSDSSGSLLVCKTMTFRYPETQSPAFKKALSRHQTELQKLKDLVGDLDAVLVHRKWIAGEEVKERGSNGLITRPVYLIRQHVFTTLADRVAMRPFLTVVEKSWIAYQVLRALECIHHAGVCHGTITSENVGLTSWGWVVLLDLGSYKPVMIPDSDPSDFIYWFQRSNGEKRCYLAPER
eukprot:CAMPEP_0172515772 /NCGR_PEP_ID=MMETSP1066-20121228/270444_1 /TAXON_ID=671091 /ORGANISM="Coscinodiscus wailesii, Strain CCMP2513" /LENGTH=221 /DNA_ID=CAMNT_0013296943 /DNA_START=46 /DNA_END=708 /DNA_ORIENTATION=-